MINMFFQFVGFDFMNARSPLNSAMCKIKHFGCICWKLSHHLYRLYGLISEHGNIILVIGHYNDLQSHNYNINSDSNQIATEWTDLLLVQASKPKETQLLIQRKGRNRSVKQSILTKTNSIDLYIICQQPLDMLSLIDFDEIPKCSNANGMNKSDSNISHASQSQQWTRKHPLYCYILKYGIVLRFNVIVSMYMLILFYLLQTPYTSDFENHVTFPPTNVWNHWQYDKNTSDMVSTLSLLYHCLYGLVTNGKQRIFCDWMKSNHFNDCCKRYSGNNLNHIRLSDCWCTAGLRYLLFKCDDNI